VKRALAGAATLATALWTALAPAHSIGVSRGTYRLTENGVTADIVFDRTELGPGAARAAATLADRVHVSAEGEPCECTLTHTREGGAASALELRLEYDCPTRSDRRSIRLDFWASLAEGHRHIVTAEEGARATRPASFADDDEFELVATTAPLSSNETSSAAPGRAPSWLGWIRHGVEHIWSGADHLLFIFALVLGVQSFRALARITLTFTLAHSITLAVAAAGVLTPPQGVVEPLIAASIAFVAYENAKHRRSRAGIVFAFGLVHGFGFAGALEEIGLLPWDQPGALAAFNVGVELGQLALLCVSVPLLRWLGRRNWFRARAVPCLNAAIAVVSLVWFSERVSAALATDSKLESLAIAAVVNRPSFRRVGCSLL
jgi:hydrogenase/urease accessory protein HupE